jgi:hypothetical protein
VKKVEWVQIPCAVCGDLFSVTPAWVRNGRRKYCTKLCHGRARVVPTRAGIAHTDASRAKMSASSVGTQLREKSSQWKGGRYLDSAGYVHVMVANLPAEQMVVAQALTKRAYVLEHRLVMSLALNRPVTRDEVVHHVNGKKEDNRQENLFVVGRKEHSAQHRHMERELHTLRLEATRLREENRVLKSRLSQSSLPGLTTSSL